MTQHNEQVEKWQREAKERLQPTLTNTRGVKKAVLDFARLLLGDFWQAQQKDLDTLISQIIADTERIAQQQVQEKVEEVEGMMEELADIEHQRWSNWQSWCHKVLRENCPSPELEKVLERWDRQIATPYSELSEQEKESDREQVRPYLSKILATLKSKQLEDKKESI